tara:strand:+ start:94 stop:333 length:240 start_codon:yes stop_codon:yes gene_type:complete
MDITKIPFYNGAIASLILAATAPNVEKEKELTALYKEDKKNLMTAIENQIVSEAERLLNSDKKVFDKWFFENIKKQNDY